MEKEEKKYVDNDVFKFSIWLTDEFCRTEKTVYTKPFPEESVGTSYETISEEMDRQEELVQKKYFTPERIAEMKKDIITRIEACENPFRISCTDRDGGYLVTEDELFDLGND